MDAVEGVGAPMTVIADEPDGDGTGRVTRTSDASGDRAGTRAHRARPS